MNYYRKKYLNCRFIIASDDKDYVKKNLGNNSDVFITPSTFFSGHDLAALALCEHTIITAGTYGWWAAWLAGGDAVHDLNYPVPFQNCVKEHYFPPWFLFPHNSSSLRWKPPNQNK
jgi:galactoside 2-L-fucosyltransferase 1/2